LHAMSPSLLFFPSILDGDETYTRGAGALWPGLMTEIPGVFFATDLISVKNACRGFRLIRDFGADVASSQHRVYA